MPVEPHVTVLGSRGASSRYGGFEDLVDQLVRGFERDGIPCCAPGIDDRFETPIPRILDRITARSKGRNVLKTLLHSWRIADEPRRTVLVVNTGNILAGLLLRRRHRVIVHLDGLEWRRRKWGPVARLVHRVSHEIALRSGLALVADSNAIADQVAPRARRGRPAVITYGGCSACKDTGAERLSRARPASGYLLMVGRPVPENQQLLVIRAHLAVHRDSQLKIAAHRDERSRYWSQVEALAAGSARVDLLGGVYEQDRLCELYRGARLVIHGHSVGGTNPSLVLALSHGCLVLAHDNPFNREVLGAMGEYWSDQDDLQLLFDSIHRLRCGLSAEEIRHVRTRYDWEDVYRRYKQLLLGGDPSV
jgi:glycosyltransferase involved in cell wall biosynthesis